MAEVTASSRWMKKESSDKVRFEKSQGGLKKVPDS